VILGHVPRPKSDLDSQVTIVLPGEWLEQAEELARARSRPGLNVTRSDVLRMALRQGLDALAAEGKAEKRRR
jgi:hypothetical protein